MSIDIEARPRLFARTLALFQRPAPDRAEHAGVPEYTGLHREDGTTRALTPQMRAAVMAAVPRPAAVAGPSDPRMAAFARIRANLGRFWR